MARAFQEGESPVAVIRALLRHLQRLHLLASRIAAGASIEEAMRAARPPIFFKQQDSYRRQLRRWSEGRLREALDLVAEAEFRMKQTGPRADTICREALFSIAAMARRTSALADCPLLPPASPGAAARVQREPAVAFQIADDRGDRAGDGLARQRGAAADPDPERQGPENSLRGQPVRLDGPAAHSRATDEYGRIEAATPRATISRIVS